MWAAKKKLQSNWPTAIRCPKGKKEDKLQCSSYRGTCLWNVFYEFV